MTMVLAHLYPALLVAERAILLTLAKNGLRIFVIAELGTRVDPGFLDRNLDHRGGIVFLAIAVVMILLIWILRRSETSQSRVIGEPMR